MYIKISFKCPHIFLAVYIFIYIYIALTLIQTVVTNPIHGSVLAMEHGTVHNVTKANAGFTPDTEAPRRAALNVLKIY